MDKSISRRKSYFIESAQSRLPPSCVWPESTVRAAFPEPKDVIAGRPIPSPQHGFLNLIHVEDAADAVMAAWSRSRYGLYVVSDDCPVIRGEFYREIARQCRAPSPRFIEAAGDSPVRMRSESNKRIWNRRMKRDLIARLRYPTYREGLASIL